MAESMRRHDAAAIGALHACRGALVGLLLFGDYLTLTASKLLTGSVGNWTLVAAVLQVPILLVSVLTIRLQRRLPMLAIAGYAGLCCVALGHCLPVWLHGDELTDYAAQKVMALFGLGGPALWIGVMVGQRDGLSGARIMPWLLAPLLLLCGLSLATNPRLLTIEYFAEPPIYFGFLVMPTHQALAFCLAKGALVCLAADHAARSGSGNRTLRLAALGALSGLVLLTGARSYAVALLAALAAQALLGSRRIAVGLAGAAVALVVFQYFASELVQDRFDPARMVESLAYRERESVWQAAWQCFVEHPLCGVGLGEFARASGWHGRVYPHNLPLEVASELGSVGLLCLALLLAAPVVSCLGLLRRRERVSMSACFGIGMTVFGVGGALAVGDLIRNYFVFFGIGLAAAAMAPVVGPAPVRQRALPVRLQVGGGTA